MINSIFNPNDLVIEKERIYESKNSFDRKTVSIIGFDDYTFGISYIDINGDSKVDIIKNGNN